MEDTCGKTDLRLYRKDYYGHHRANDVYTTAKGCCACAHNNLTGLQRSILQFISLNVLLAFVTMAILRELLKTLNGNQVFLVIMDHYSKLKWSLPTYKTTTSAVGSWFIFNCVAPSGYRSSHVLIDVRPHFFSKLVESLWALLGTKQRAILGY